MLKHSIQVYELLLCSLRWQGRAGVPLPVKFLSLVASVSSHHHQVRG